MKYEAPSTAPESFKEYQLWLIDELRHLADAMVQLETDAVLLKEWNVEPDKLYNGLVAYADGTNWNPGDGRGLYLYNGNDWELLSGGGGFVTLDTAQEIDGLKTFNNKLEIIDGHPLHIEGTTVSEFVEISVDSAANTVNVDPTGPLSWRHNMGFDIRGGGTFRVTDSGNTDWGSWNHNGTDMTVSHNLTRRHAFTGLTEGITDGGNRVGLIKASVTADLEQDTHPINTSKDKILGAYVYNQTTNKPVWADGPAATSVWVDATGATVHTPV